jgi:hypothetical protein
MDTKFTEHSKWTDEEEEEYDKEKVKRRLRRKKWYKHLGLNKELIIKELPITCNYFRNQEKNSKDTISVKVGHSMYRDVIISREHFPEMFTTNSDVARSWMVMGHDIFEETFLDPENKNMLKNNEAYRVSKTISYISDRLSILAMVRKAMNEIIEYHINSLINEEEFLAEIGTIFKDLKPDVLLKSEQMLEDILSEKGLKKINSRLRKRKQRENEYLSVVK